MPSKRKRRDTAESEQTSASDLEQSTAESEWTSPLDLEQRLDLHARLSEGNDEAAFEVTVHSESDVKFFVSPSDLWDELETVDRRKLKSGLVITVGECVIVQLGKHTSVALILDLRAYEDFTYLRVLWLYRRPEISKRITKVVELSNLTLSHHMDIIPGESVIGNHIDSVEQHFYYDHLEPEPKLKRGQTLLEHLLCKGDAAIVAKLAGGLRQNEDETTRSSFTQYSLSPVPSTQSLGPASLTQTSLSSVHSTQRSPSPVRSIRSTMETPSTNAIVDQAVLGHHAATDPVLNALSHITLELRCNGNRQHLSMRGLDRSETFFEAIGAKFPGQMIHKVELGSDKEALRAELLESCCVHIKSCFDQTFERFLTWVGSNAHDINAKHPLSLIALLIALKPDRQINSSWGVVTEARSAEYVETDTQGVVNIEADAEPSGSVDVETAARIESVDTGIELLNSKDKSPDGGTSIASRSPEHRQTCSMACRPPSPVSTTSSNGGKVTHSKPRDPGGHPATLNAGESRARKTQNWTSCEDELLESLIKAGKSWDNIEQSMNGRSKSGCKQRWGRLKQEYPGIPQQINHQQAMSSVASLSRPPVMLPPIQSLFKGTELHDNHPDGFAHPQAESAHHFSRHITADASDGMMTFRI